ncbi:MAG: putative competence lipoprotein precursor, partial [Pseudomonadota bacterium]
AQAAVRKYPQAPAIEEALYVMMASYDKLGLSDLRDDAERVLRLNFPNTTLPAQGLPEARRRWWEIWK